MIKVTVDMSKHEVTISGHAQYDEKGKDIVCAAVSILFYTLVETLEAGQKMLRKNSLKKIIKEGESLVSCVPLKAYEPNVALVFFTIMNGIQLLADDYPENVTFTVVG